MSRWIGIVENQMICRMMLGQGLMYDPERAHILTFFKGSKSNRVPRCVDGPLSHIFKIYISRWRIRAKS